MTVIEYFSVSKKGSNECNEDAWFIGERFVAVIDGVTSKTARPASTNISSGRFAAQTIIKLLETMPHIVQSEQILEWLNENLKKIVSNSIFSSQVEPPAASVIIYDTITNKIISYGDCQVLIGGTVHKREKKLDTICAEKRAKILHNCLKNGQSKEFLLKNDLGRKAIEPDILDAFLKYANKKTSYGFPVLGTGKIIPDFINEYETKQGDEIVFASDGYPVLMSTLSQSEEILTHIIASDPLLIKDFKSTKGVYEGNISYDDRTYIRFVT